MDSPNWRPTSDRILVKKIEDSEQVSESGLFIVSHEQNDKTKRAEVVSVGPGVYKNGNYIPVPVSPGDIVIYNGMYGTDVGSFHTSSDNEYMILHEEDILAVIS